MTASAARTTPNFNGSCFIKQEFFPTLHNIAFQYEKTDIEILNKINAILDNIYHPDIDRQENILDDRDIAVLTDVTKILLKKNQKSQEALAFISHFFTFLGILPPITIFVKEPVKPVPIKVLHIQIQQLQISEQINNLEQETIGLDKKIQTLTNSINTIKAQRKRGNRSGHNSNKLRRLEQQRSRLTTQKDQINRQTENLKRELIILKQNISIAYKL